ncbi:MAG: DEAD/DEAH box helicase family protein [Holosporaceae bacterium]|jgi:SNF2 family DNA or RNA helicase/uncharacterized Zn finger protein|nr:DEAD/DEAH box helicase family protein [Holosporaceae bacterium]
MAIKTYGKTWWGKKWLDTFNGIDDENRLPRGRTYANKGTVSAVKINGSTVTALVQGTYQYRVKVKFEAFTWSQKDTIRRVIEKSPSILLSLMNKRLSSKLYKVLEGVGINLFPTEWKEVQANCSCPDYAVPCKHIAALLYVICDKIDADPFVVFSLHDCSLESIIDNFGEYKQTQKSIAQIETLFGGKTTKVDFCQPILDNIDLSKIPDLKSTTLSILQSTPVFYEKKFIEKMEHFYDVIGAAKLKKEVAECDFLGEFPSIELCDNVEVCMDSRYRVTAINITNGQKKVAYVSVMNVFDFFQKMPNSLLHLLHPSLRFLHMVFLFTLKLMEKHALIPQILQNFSEETLIRWIPANYNEEVRTITDSLAQTCPSIVTAIGDPREQVLALASMFVTSKRLSMNLNSLKLVGDDILHLFFGGGICNFKDFSKKEIPSAINQWLNNFHENKKKYKLCLEITDLDEEFQLDLKVILDYRSSNEPVSLDEAFRKVPSSVKFDILSDISALADYLPDFEDIIDNHESIIFKLTEFTNVFFTILPVLRAVGVYIALPKSLREIFTPKLRLNISTDKKAKNSGLSFVSLSNLLNFDWTIAIGDQDVSLSEFKNILKKSNRFVRFANRYVLLDEKQIESMLKRFDKLPQKLSKAEIIQAALSEEYEFASVKMDNQLTELFSKIKRCDAKPLPQNLKAKLRAYQERGYSWLLQNIENGFGSILADDMGLGKTLQVIAVILHMKNSGCLIDEKVLVIAPTSLLTNWKREVEKFAPDLRSLIYHGNKRELTGEFEVVFTSYGIACRDKNILQKHEWFLLVIDEAQNIKNPTTKQTKTVKSIEAKHRIAISGTPVENRLLEYWSIFDFTNKGYLGTQANFVKKIASPIEKERNKDCLDKFLKISSPFILRRCKSDKSIIADLPEKLESNRYCSLTKEQAAIYQQILNESMDSIENSEGIERRGLVLKLINSLKQVCNHPSHYGKRPIASIDESGKTKMLEEILGEIHESGEKTLIFTQYVEMGKILIDILEDRFKWQIPFLHGGLSRQKRDEIVCDFQENSQTRVLILSLHAGGTGLNLTAANHVIHYDLWWNPAVESQATDRAYRIGQLNNVFVNRFITVGTFEERIDEMIQNKKDLANIVVADGEKWITEFDNDQLKDLFKLR